MSKARNYTAMTRARIADAWRTVANTSEGQLVIAELMAWCYAYQPIETNDPVEMARLVGENNVVKHIAGFLGYRPEDFAVKADEDLELLNRMTEAVWKGQSAH
jgi:hypothetical protein